MPRERKALGYGRELVPSYVLDCAENATCAEAVLKEADVVIAGSAPEALIRPCILRGQLVFRYSERPLKNGAEWHKYIPRFLKWHWRNPAQKPVYLLCASAYTKPDYKKFGLFRNRAFRFGYFPETVEYSDPAEMIGKKKPASIIWCGRLLDWKHPEALLKVAASLLRDGIDFAAEIVGTGPMEPFIRQEIESRGLVQRVHLVGAVPPDEVRRKMEAAEIFLFTSDRKEGWGAVLNEAMNSGCAVLASDAAGATPWLVRDGENGVVFPSEDWEALYAGIRRLMEDRALRQRMALAAYHTIRTEWNASVAADRLVKLCDNILNTGAPGTVAERGPCSRAE